MNASFQVAPDCEIRSSRIFDYPRQTVFRAWTDPFFLQQWWGPAGFTNTFHSFDLRPGGRWKFTMHGPEKGHYANEVEFLRIDPPSLLVWERISEPLFRVVTSFEDAGAGKTLLVFRMQFASPEACEKIRRFAVDKNEENFDRLEQILPRVAGLM